MYEYKFVEIQVGAFSGKPKDDYREVIHQHAKDGWRLHQFVPLPFGAGRQSLSIELIFEKEIKE
jgi:hypothetical protein